MDLSYSFYVKFEFYNMEMILLHLVLKDEKQHV